MPFFSEKVPADFEGSIRLDKDAYGLRFAAEIGQTAPAENEEYHMMIFPAAYISNYSLLCLLQFTEKFF